MQSVGTISAQVIDLLDHALETVHNKTIGALHHLHQRVPDIVTQQELEENVCLTTDNPHTKPRPSLINAQLTPHNTMVSAPVNVNLCQHSNDIFHFAVAIEIRTPLLQQQQQIQPREST